MKRTAREKQERRLTVIQGISFLLTLLSISAFDSECITIPLVALAVAGTVLFVTARLDFNRKGGAEYVD